MRHYYDVYCLLDDASVQAFIGSADYVAHKARRFAKADEKDLTRNEAFALSDPSVRDAYGKAYASTSARYFRGQPEFDEVLARIQRDAHRL